MPDADADVRALVRELASGPATAVPDEHAKGNMMSWRITTSDVLDAVCEAIDQGARLKQTTVKTHPPGLVGQPAYEIKPLIDGRRFYVRLAVFEPSVGRKALLLLSVHLDV